MSNNKNNDERKYIIDRFSTHQKSKNKKGPKERKREPLKRSVDDSSTVGLGCWFFLILPFIAMILILIVIIGLFQ
ncbi:hypothetical protein [Salinicoccus sp. YB14-2]|uniref:hypothetical protein n=1 Tax=Salinicoccus sp. YB14-2 TaxID=1572701 RepID=UPI00068DD365|nr:hypothetical protein [Salinicoccus sp. YB14-2]